MLRKDPFVTGEYYHLFNRGIDKRIIFKSKADYARFVMLLYVSNSLEDSFRLDNLINRLHKKFDEVLTLDRGKKLVSIGSWCLMRNHFHILIRQEIDGGITKFMKKLGTGYSMYFNIKYERQGALFGGPFKSKLVGADDNYMKQLFAYLHLNPLEIKFPNWQESIGSRSNDMRDFLKEYPYSSYTDLLSKTKAGRVEKNIINIDNFPAYFEETDSFQEFVENYFIETSEEDF